MHRHGSGEPLPSWAAPTGPRHRQNEAVDFVVVGSGAAGGVMARELSRAGFSVVVLEQGPYLRESDFTHDEFAVWHHELLTNDHRVAPNTFRATERDPAKVTPMVRYGRMVGGGSNHYTANFWRFRPIDFIEKTRTGGVAGAALADWPITYDDLEPYYDRVEWEVGVSGQGGLAPGEPHRARDYPVPPLPIKSTGVLAEKGAAALGWHATPSPMAILSRPYKGRAACIQCGMCMGYGCEVRAKSGALSALLPDAEATGRCEIRPLSTVRKVEVDRHGRVIGVKYFDAAREERFQRAKAVVLCANGAETPRLLLMSRSNRFPQGLANSSGMVGRHLMFNGGAPAAGVFEHEVNGYRGMVDTRVILDTYELDPSLGIAGGGGFDFRWMLGPLTFANNGFGADQPSWGARYAEQLRRHFTQSVQVLGHTTQLPVATNMIDLDESVKDQWGMPAIRVTFTDHENDLRLMRWFSDRAHDLLRGAGAVRTWGPPGGTRGFPQVHLLGTCRMGNDPASSVVDASHRAHDVPNLFIVDGSSFVTSGRGQPTETIMALAFRAADRATRLAKRGELARG